LGVRATSTFWREERSTVRCWASMLRRTRSARAVRQALPKLRSLGWEPRTICSSVWPASSAALNPMPRAGGRQATIVAWDPNIHCRRSKAIDARTICRTRQAEPMSHRLATKFPADSRRRSAIVSNPGGGDRAKSEDQPHARQIAYAPQPAMRRADESGSRCRSPVMPNGRCRLHGGMSPGAPRGNKNALKHGRYTAEAIAQRRQISALVREMKALAGASR